jgi:hypothetical protein
MQWNHAPLRQALFDASDESRLLREYRKLNLLKLVVTGDGRGGKTSLLRCLRGEDFNPLEPSTCGVELCTVEVGAEKWAITDLAAVGDLAAGLLAKGFREQQQHAAAAAAAKKKAEEEAKKTADVRQAGLDPNIPHLRRDEGVGSIWRTDEVQEIVQMDMRTTRELDPAHMDIDTEYPGRVRGYAPRKEHNDTLIVRRASPVPDGPIAITRDLPLLPLCVAEGSELSLSVRVSGGTPNEPLQYRWSRDGAVVDGQTSNTLRIARASSSAFGEYYVEVSCQSQPTPVKSIVAKVRIVSSVTDKVNKILEQRESLTDDKPKAAVFDCGGQRIYCAVQRLLVTEPLTVYIIVVSLADDLDDQLRCPEDLRYSMTHRQNLVFWLDTIYCHAKKAKIIVVGSKVDEIDEETRKERMAEVAQCVESTLSCAKDMIALLTDVSSKRGKGIDELRTQIEALRPQLDRYGEKVPVGWFKFFSISQELVLNYDQQRISYAEARDIAAHQCGIVTDDDLQSMLQLFNDAGLLLWRSKEAIARELVVLNVDWIVKLMISASCPR